MQTTLTLKMALKKITCCFGVMFSLQNANANIHKVVDGYCSFIQKTAQLQSHLEKSPNFNVSSGKHLFKDVSLGISYNLKNRSLSDNTLKIGASKCEIHKYKTLIDQSLESILYHNAVGVLNYRKAALLKIQKQLQKEKAHQKSLMRKGLVTLQSVLPYNDSLQKVNEQILQTNGEIAQLTKTDILPNLSNQNIKHYIKSHADYSYQAESLLLDRELINSRSFILGVQAYREKNGGNQDIGIGLYGSFDYNLGRMSSNNNLTDIEASYKQYLRANRNSTTSQINNMLASINIQISAQKESMAFYKKQLTEVKRMIRPVKNIPSEKARSMLIALSFRKRIYDLEINVAHYQIENLQMLAKQLSASLM